MTFHGVGMDFFWNYALSLALKTAITFFIIQLIIKYNYVYLTRQRPVVKSDPTLLIPLIRSNFVWPIAGCTNGVPLYCKLYNVHYIRQ